MKDSADNKVAITGLGIICPLGIGIRDCWQNMLEGKSGIKPITIIEFAATALSLDNGIILPTINYEVPDPECDLDYVPNEAREIHDI